MDDWAKAIEDAGGRLRPGCSAEEIRHAESALGQPLPLALTSFLLRSNGLVDEWGYDYGWSLAKIVDETRRPSESDGAQLDPALIAFGGDGSGGWFALPWDSAQADGVYHWNWIELEATRCLAAADLTVFWRSWMEGSITA